MSIKYYANRVQETSTSTGSGNLVLGGSPLGYRTFTAAIGANNTITYYIYRQDTNFEWEVGVGYISSGGGTNQLVRQRVVASSNGNSLVGFTTGTKYVEAIISQDRVNTSFTNVEEKGSNFTAPYMPATYIVDASTTGVQVTLPGVASQNDPIVLGFLLNKTIGSAYEQSNAIQLIPSGTETIAGLSGTDVSILNDYLQIISVPSQSGWLLLDPIQDATNPYGNEGTIQFKSNGAFSGVDDFIWHSSNKLLIGDSGVATADVVIPASSGQTTIFNQNLFDNDLRVAGSGNSHLLFVDGGLSRLGINTSSVPDTLSINANTGSGITISRSGTGPSILFNNTSISGITTNNVIGSIVFSGLSTSGNTVQYGRISNVVESTVEAAEYSNFTFYTANNGGLEEIAVFSPSGITLGSNTQNIDGVVLGAGSNNEGNNVVAGYFNNVCGENCVVLGDNIVVSSGTFGGAVGSDHSVSGTNLWILGGSGVSVTGINKTILALDSDNYIQIVESGNLKYTTLSDSNLTFMLENVSVLTSGINQNIAFTFLNTSGVVKTGLLVSSSISDVTNLTEDSSFVTKILSSGTQRSVLDLSAAKLVIGTNTTSGNNIIFGIDNVVSNSNNVVYGSGIAATGSNNILIGHDINLMASGTGITIIGRDNDCLSSGNFGVVIVGNGNESNEDYSIAIGIDNANSGLYSVSCGYLNGSHGDYTVSVGESNLVQSNYSVAIGRNNNLSTTDLNGSIFAMGVGNTGTISNTGVIVGYLNTMQGSGSNVLGVSCSVSGTKNVVVGNNSTVLGSGNIVIGNNRSVNGTGIIDIAYNATNGLLATSSGFYLRSDSDFIFNNDIIVTGIGTFASGVVSSGNINCSGTGIFSSISVVNGISSNSGIFNSIRTSGNINCSGTGIFSNITSLGTGVFAAISCSGNITTSGLSITSMPALSGTGSVSMVSLQNNILKSTPVAFSGVGGTIYLTTSSAKYQFISSTANIYLPDSGPSNTSLYLGKEFFIFNMSASTITIYSVNADSGSPTTLLNVLFAGQCIIYSYAGNHTWVAIAASTLGS